MLRIDYVIGMRQHQAIGTRSEWRSAAAEWTLRMHFECIHEGHPCKAAVVLFILVLATRRKPPDMTQFV